MSQYEYYNDSDIMTPGELQYEIDMEELEKEIKAGHIDCSECGEQATCVEYGEPVCDACKWGD